MGGCGRTLSPVPLLGSVIHMRLVAEFAGYLSASLTASMPACAQLSSWSPVPPLTPMPPICTLSSVMTAKPPGRQCWALAPVPERCLL